MTYDIAIIGSGPGGYVGAIRAAQLNAKVVLIEKNEIGGTCLNKGCIPTKALAASAHALDNVKNLENFGISNSISKDIKVDFQNIINRKNKIVDELRKGIEQLLKKSKIDIIQGEAKIISNNKLKVTSFSHKHTSVIPEEILIGNPVPVQEIEAKNILIATGSNWWYPENLIPDNKLIITSDHLLDSSDLPDSLLIVGGGVVGCEFASILNSFGVKVSIVEATDSILSTVEKTISGMLLRNFKKSGIDVFTNTTVKKVDKKDNNIKATLSSDIEKEFDKILVCVGRKPYLDNLGIDKIGIKLTDKGAIEVNKKFKTSVPSIYAIGDVIGNYMLAHVASSESVSCIEQIFSKTDSFDYKAVPSPIFTNPEIAGVGQTSQELTEKNIEFKTGRFSYMASGKAKCDGEKDGLVLVHADKDGKILGAHFYGKDATLLVAEATLAIQNNLTIHDIEKTIHSHPTLSEVFLEACLDAENRAIHKAKRP